MMLIIWAALTIFFMIVEAVLVGIVSVWFAIGSLVAFFLDLFGLNIKNMGIAAVYVQVVVAIIVSFLLLFLLGPFIRKKLKGQIVATNKDALIGATAVVTEKILPNTTGRAKLGHQDWAAISEDNSEIAKGKVVQVLKIEGVKLIVKENKGEDE